MSKPDITDKQAADIKRLQAHVAMVRGLQVTIVAISVYLAIAGKRGIVAVLIGIGFAILYQLAAMPRLPKWIDRQRPGDE